MGYCKSVVVDSYAWVLMLFFQRDDYFNRCLRNLGFEIKTMNEDGACLFRAIADQVYGDQELHYTVRSQCMDYIVRSRFINKLIFFSIRNEIIH